MSDSTHQKQPPAKMAVSAIAGEADKNTTKAARRKGTENLTHNDISNACPHSGISSDGRYTSPHNGVRWISVLRDHSRQHEASCDRKCLPGWNHPQNPLIYTHSNQAGQIRHPLQDALRASASTPRHYDGNFHPLTLQISTSCNLSGSTRKPITCRYSPTFLAHRPLPSRASHSQFLFHQCTI